MDDWPAWDNWNPLPSNLFIAQLEVGAVVGMCPVIIVTLQKYQSDTLTSCSDWTGEKRVRKKGGTVWSSVLSFCQFSCLQMTAMLEGQERHTTCSICNTTNRILQLWNTTTIILSFIVVIVRHTVKMWHSCYKYFAGRLCSFAGSPRWHSVFTDLHRNDQVAVCHTRLM